MTRRARRTIASPRVQRVDGWVWCDKVGAVHEDTLDPYEYGPPERGFDDMRCAPSDHRVLFAAAMEDVR